jgi:hypothetical protein
MRPYKKRKRRRLQRLIHQYKQALKFSLYVAALVILIIGNNFASFRSDDQPGQGNYTGGNSSPGDNKATGGVQQGLTSIYPNTPLNPNLGIVKQLQTESMFVNPWNNIWRSGGQWERFYIQSAMNLQQGGLRDWEDYLSASPGFSAGNHQNLGEGQSGSFSSLLNHEGGGENPPGMIGPPLEYPHATNYGGGYDTGSAGGSLGSTSSGGSGSGSEGPETNNGPVQIPEPSTLILSAIGLLLVITRVSENRIQGVKSRQRRERIPVTQSDECSE